VGPAFFFARFVDGYVFRIEAYIHDRSFPFVTRHEANLLWKLIIELRCEKYAAAERLGVSLLRDALREFSEEDATTTAAELKEALRHD